MEELWNIIGNCLNGGYICEYVFSNNIGNYFIYVLVIDCLYGERR